MHPFIAILAHPKGKKLISRVFRQIDDQQRLTIITMIVVHLDSLDVVHDDVPVRGTTLPPKPVQQAIDLFQLVVVPSLFSYINDAPLGIIIGLLSLVIDRVPIQSIARSKVALHLLTELVSRAELIAQSKSAHAANEDAQWSALYNRLFDTLEPLLLSLFVAPMDDPKADDVQIWQFLAALGIGASQDQQQRLVIAVKDRVMGTVEFARTLPEERGQPRLQNVNLFMRAIGLDVDLLSG